MANQFQASEGVAAEDVEILEGMQDGASVGKEDADKAVSRMLEEEEKAGRGKADGHAESEAEPEGEEAGQEDVEKQKKEEETRSQRRARQRRENIQRAQAERDKWQREVGKLQERVKQLEGRAISREAYGEDQETYIADRAGYAAQHAAATQSAEEARESAKAADEAVAKANREAMDDYFSDGNKKYPDFERTLKSDALNFTPAMVEALMEDGLHDLAYELAKQPAEVARIAALSPTAQVKEITRAQARLEAKAAESKTTKAPPPIKPVRAAGASQSKSPSEMNMSEYAAFRKQQIAASR